MTMNAQGLETDTLSENGWSELYLALLSSIEEHVSTLVTLVRVLLIVVIIAGTLGVVYLLRIAALLGWTF